MINNRKGTLKMGIRSTLKGKIDDIIELSRSMVASGEVAEQRLSVCNSCEFLSKARTCKKCGCLVDAKTRLANQRCPLHKW